MVTALIRCAAVVARGCAALMTDPCAGGGGSSVGAGFHSCAAGQSREIAYAHRKKASAERAGSLAGGGVLGEYGTRLGGVAGAAMDKKSIDRRWLPLNALRAFEGVAKH